MRFPTLLRTAVVVAPLCAALPVTGCKKEKSPAPASSTPNPAPTGSTPASSTASTATQQFSWKQITLSYPKTWKAAARDDAGGAEIVGPQDGDWEPNLFLKIHPNNENESAGEILTERLAQLAAAKPSFSLSDRQYPLKLPNGMDYARLAYKSKDETSRVDLVQWYFVIPLPDKRWLEIQANAAEDSWDRQKPVIEQVVNSIQIKK